MLVLSRKKNQEVRLTRGTRDIVIKVIAIQAGQVKLAITTPDSYIVFPADLVASKESKEKQSSMNEERR